MVSPVTFGRIIDVSLTPAVLAVWLLTGMPGSALPASAAVVVPAAVYKQQAGSFLIVSGVPGATSFDIQVNDDVQGLAAQYVANARTSGGMRPQADVQGHLSWNTSKPQSEFAVVSLLAEASIQYYFAVVPVNGDPHDMTPVPIILTARGHADASGPGVSATATAFGVSLNELATAPLGTGMFDTTITTDQVPNIVRTVFIRARGSVSANLFTFPSGTAEFQAVADPLIEIAPDFALRELYRIEFSANLVPLPMSVWMLGSAVVVMTRVRRRSA